MEDNKMYCKPIYKCGICGKEYPSIAERMKCEQSCLKQQEEEAKKAAEAKKRAEKESRRAEVTNAIEHAKDLLEKYIADYEYYSYNGKESSDPFEAFWPSKLWHHFL